MSAIVARKSLQSVSGGLRPILMKERTLFYNAMPKYVFSSTLEHAHWNNSTIIRGDVVAEVSRLKQQEGRDLLIYGHGLLGETLLKGHLLDVLDLSIHPLVLGQGKQFFREGQNATLRLVAARSYSKGLVKLTYEPQY